MRETGEVKTFYAMGAYGRKANETDWKEGKDFRCCATGQYFSNRDLDYLRERGYTQILFTNGYDRSRPIFKVRI